MAALTHGPRLGNPSSSGFSAWVRCDGAATVALETKLPTATAWTVNHTTAIDTTKQNTAVLTATGLLSSTKYDYRIKVDGVVAATYYTITMPADTGGHFLVYHTGDFHDAHIPSPSNDDSLAAYMWIKDDWIANHAPNNTPAVILQLGDLYTFGSLNPAASTLTAEQAFTGVPVFDFNSLGVLGAVATLDEAGATHYLPLLFMWDDWDYAGNNSSSATGVYNDPSVVDAQAEAALIWDWTWRDHAQPAAPSFGYTYVIGGVPFIVSDSRSQKSGGLILSGTPVVWQDPAREANTCWGITQRDWLKSEVATYAGRGLVFFVSSTTFRDPRHPARSPFMTGGARDSLGVYHKAERNYVFKDAAGLGYGSKTGLIVLSGDDHYDVVWKDVLHTNDLSPGNTSQPVSPQYPGKELSLQYIEVKTRGDRRASTNAGGSPTLFNIGELFSYYTKALSAGEGNGCVVVWDLTSSNTGEQVSGRATFRVTNPGTNVDNYSVGDTLLDDDERPGDFYFENAYFEAYRADGAQQQLYPPDHAAAADGPLRERWDVDEVTGLLHPRSTITRDLEERLRYLPDIDDPGRDDYPLETPTEAPLDPL